ncbi:MULTISPECIES: DNA-methyltransferase [Pseudomonas]|uniref:DNA-methyltransferase n=1 Tax=Pseudomonas TaxID=286 RepID=UPI001C65F397|nr:MULTISPECIES: site-specific DNA-methyltransferase [unclassified Pseudomonas]MBW8127527.1 site-specific DNA-methyltransferase [Pseudomonas sp. LAP_36]MBW8139303.1 site-specific DNA-methyltransferase [Pseudomonas sp. PAMC 26818]
MNQHTILIGDCIELMRQMPENSVDSVVTDPPYGIRFMGKSWDGQDIESRAAYRDSMPSADPACGVTGGHRSTASEAGKYDLTPSGMKAFQSFTFEWATECLRVLKPGGHLLSFAAARTYHHMAVGIEMAGFEIRDQIMWVFGSGFPKSHNLKGAHQGWGTALKPAHEPICVARKPFSGTVATNVAQWGTGALNVDGCRIGVTDETYARNCSGDRGSAGTRSIEQHGATNIRAGGGAAGSGRWPANLIHDGSQEVVAMFPAEAGASAPVLGTEPTSNGFSGSVKYSGMRERVAGAFHGDSGSAARFFYCAKTSRTDRHEGLSNPGHQFKMGTTLRKVQTTDTKGNNHPTVKPTDLMAYLCRLVTPAGGVVLDPFMGSGSTGKAAIREGFQFVGCEIDLQYAAIAQARIEHEQEQPRQLAL